MFIKLKPFLVISFSLEIHENWKLLLPHSMLCVVELKGIEHLRKSINLTNFIQLLQTSESIAFCSATRSLHTRNMRHENCVAEQSSQVGKTSTHSQWYRQYLISVISFSFVVHKYEKVCGCSFPHSRTEHKIIAEERRAQKKSSNFFVYIFIDCLSLFGARGSAEKFSSKFEYSKSLMINLRFSDAHLSSCCNLNQLLDAQSQFIIERFSFIKFSQPWMNT